VDLTETHRILRGALEGGPEALGALLERLRPRLVLWCAARMSPQLRAQVEPEDVAQEVLLAVHKDFGSFSGGSDREFFGWLFKVAENRLRDLVDYHGAQKRQAVEPKSFTQTSPSEGAVRAEMIQRVHRAIAVLPEDYRRVIQLRRLEDREVPEVAQILERSENAVRVLYCRALKDLRRALDADGA
jgi:RNA polymerase sigma-70 factor, ECF subfamily